MVASRRRRAPRTRLPRHDTIFSGLRTIVSDFSALEQGAPFHDNAARFYRLD
jgi:predicted TIM-barrel fold metal-dependent hydrolase